MKGKSQQTRPCCLTPREREIVELAARDMPDKQIADALGLSPATVNHHWRQILAKLNLHSRTAAVALIVSMERIA